MSTPSPRSRRTPKGIALIFSIALLPACVAVVSVTRANQSTPPLPFAPRHASAATPSQPLPKPQPTPTPQGLASAVHH